MTYEDGVKTGMLLVANLLESDSTLFLSLVGMEPCGEEGSVCNNCLCEAIKRHASIIQVVHKDDLKNETKH